MSRMSTHFIGLSPHGVLSEYRSIVGEQFIIYQAVSSAHAVLRSIFGVFLTGRDARCTMPDFGASRR